MSELPEPWVTWASRVGVRASLTGIGEAAGGLPASTVSRLVHQGKTSQATVEAVASALRVDVATVLEAATGASGHGTWRPPLESHLLTPPERDALAVIIRAMTSGRSGAGADLHAVPDWARRVVTVDCRLSAVQRRCTLAHELVHVERGPVPRDPWLAAREEAAVEAEAARRLIPLDALAGALAWSRRPDEVAEELWVDVQTLAVRIGGLSDVERVAVGLR